MRKLNKKGGTSPVIWIMLLLVFVAVAAVVWIAVQMGKPAQIVEREVIREPGAEVVTVTPSIITCPTDKTTTAKARAQIPLDLNPTLTYLNGVTVYAIPSDLSKAKLVNVTTSGTTGGWGTVDDLKCGVSGLTYKSVAIDSAGVSGAAIGTSFTPEGDEATITLEVPAVSPIEGRIKHIENDAYLYNHSGPDPQGDAQSFATLPQQYANFSDATVLNMTTNTIYTFEFNVRATTANEQFGNSDFEWKTKDGVVREPKCYVAVDADSSAYKRPEAVSWNGASRKDIKSTLVANDMNKLSDYEYAFETGVVGDTISTLSARTQSKSGIQPTSSNDILIWWICEGLYKSSEAADTIYLGAFDDSSSQTEVHGSTYRMTLNQTNAAGA